MSACCWGPVERASRPKSSQIEKRGPRQEQTLQSIKSKLGNLQKKVNEVMRITSLLERAMLVTMVCEVWRGGGRHACRAVPGICPPLHYCTTCVRQCIWLGKRQESGWGECGGGWGVATSAVDIGLGGGIMIAHAGH